MPWLKLEKGKRVHGSRQVRPSLKNSAPTRIWTGDLLVYPTLYQLSYQSFELLDEYQHYSNNSVVVREEN